MVTNFLLTYVNTYVIEYAFDTTRRGFLEILNLCTTLTCGTAGSGDRLRRRAVSDAPSGMHLRYTEKQLNNGPHWS